MKDYLSNENNLWLKVLVIPVGEIVWDINHVKLQSNDWITNKLFELYLEHKHVFGIYCNWY